MRPSQRIRPQSLGGGTFCFLIIFVCAFLSVSRFSFADEPENTAPQHDAATMAKDYIGTVIEEARLRAEIEPLQKLHDRLEATVASDSITNNVCQDLKMIDDELRASMANVMRENNLPVVDGLSQAQQQLKIRERELFANWLDVRSSVYDRKLKFFEVKATQRLTGQLAYLLNVDNRYFWLFGLVAIAGLAAAAVHERRHEVRRRLNGGRARAMGLSRLIGVLILVLSVVTVGTFVFGESLFQMLLVVGSGEASSPRDEIAKASQDAADALNRTQTQHEQLTRQVKPLIDKTKGRLQQLATEGGPVIQQWENSLTQCRAVQAALVMQQEISERLEKDAQELDKLQQDFGVAAQAVDSAKAMRRWICGGLGIGLLGLAFIGGAAFKRGVRRRQERTRNTCPMCLGEGKFMPVDAAGLSQASLSYLQCTNVISESPREECEFKFAATYQDLSKLCFPTLGIPQAGKTHWLAMVYRELNRGNHPGFVQFDKVKSPSSDEFDRIVDDLLNRKVSTAATQAQKIPYPLVFNFIDHDRWGISGMLLSIFDYSGEVLQRQNLEYVSRQRALDADGYLFFLDPTFPSDEQADALVRFREDLKQLKGVKLGEQLRTPVALCVSKIDLMAAEPYADPDGGGIIGNFYRDLGEIGWETNLQSIQARSNLVAQLRDTVWPGWPIEKQVDNLFGGRHMFFPLTPVGLDQLGERDLSRRVIAPVGLLDPLLWLLHMNGYPVLS